MKIELFAYLTGIVLFGMSLSSRANYIPPSSLYCKSIYVGDVWCNDVNSNYVFAKGSINSEVENFFFVSAEATWGEVGYPDRSWHIDFKYTNSDGTRTVWLSTFDGRVQPIYSFLSRWESNICIERLGCIIGRISVL